MMEENVLEQQTTQGVMLRDQDHGSHVADTIVETGAPLPNTQTSTKSLKKPSGKPSSRPPPPPPPMTHQQKIELTRKEILVAEIKNLRAVEKLEAEINQGVAKSNEIIRKTNALLDSFEERTSRQFNLEEAKKIVDILSKGVNYLDWK